MPQHCPFELLQFARGLDAELLHEQRAHTPVRREGLGLSPGAVEREHPVSPEALPQRVLRDEQVELGHHLVGTPERELRFGAVLERDEAYLLEAGDLGLREGRVREVGERRSAPQRQRVVEAARSRLRVAGRQRGGALAHEALEAPAVQPIRRDAQHVAGAVRHERLFRAPLPALRLERRAEL